VLKKVKTETDSKDDLIGLPVEPTGLEGSAFQSRVPFDKMTQVEAACFPDLVTQVASQKLFLQLRNRILQLWLENPKKQLVAGDCLGRLAQPWDSDKALVTRKHAFMERHGYINFGIYKRVAPPALVKGKVVVIGAGIAGLAAAGMEVWVVEARNRVGAGLQPVRKGPYIAGHGGQGVGGQLHHRPQKAGQHGAEQDQPEVSSVGEQWDHCAQVCRGAQAVHGVGGSGDEGCHARVCLSH
jgi:lysine-specific histone demethylase 1